MLSPTIFEDIFRAIVDFISTFDPSSLFQNIYTLGTVLKIMSGIMTVLFIVGIIYTIGQMREVKRKDDEKIAEKIKKLQKTENKVNLKWQRIEDHASSDNPSDWRLAILEADIMLGELLEKLNYQGATIGEKLKGVVKGDFENLQNAWDAHTIRNAIAHEGSDFEITDREARRVIGLFEKVFKEFDFI